MENNLKNSKNRKKIATFLVIGSLLMGFGGQVNAKSVEGDIYMLTSEYARQISKGEIRTENDEVDSLLYNKEVLNPNADDDKDGMLNKFEIYIYEKNGKKYYGYRSHPRLSDTDGDGLDDKKDKKPLKWDISPRDMALFMELVYRDENYINKVLDNTKSLNELYKDRLEYSLMHNELAPFWKLKKIYRDKNGFDAALFETNSSYPYLENGNVQVLAIRGTAGGEDLDDDAALGVGSSPAQAETVKNVINELNRTQEVDNLYITGHSLGGYLSQRALIEAKTKGYDWVKKAYTFNAPKIKKSIFKNSINKLSKKGDQLTKEGLAKHYKVDNDNVIGIVGNFAGAESIGRSNRGHSSRSYFEERINGREGFSIGNRNEINGIGYREENLNNLKFETLNQR